ncbi:MAG: murein transglycosylase [Pantoea sp. Brub]|nr:murein transglycosylase [Pantoea sp. Brub]
MVYFFLIIFIITKTCHAYAASIQEQRLNYKTIMQSLKHNNTNTVLKLLPTLKNYSLYPYLEYRIFLKNINKANTTSTKKIIYKYSKLPFINILKTSFINLMAKRKNWPELLKFSPNKPSQISAQCNWYHAKWVLENKKTAFEGIKKIWLNNTSLPKACNNFVSIWQKRDKYFPFAVLERIRLCMQKNSNKNAIIKLSTLLPKNYHTIANLIVSLCKEPTSVNHFNKVTTLNRFTFQAIKYAVVQITYRHKNTKKIKQVINNLLHSHKFNQNQIKDLKEIIAWNLMINNISSTEQKWRDEIIINNKSTKFIERRIRLILSTQNKDQLNVWLNYLPKNIQKKDEWQYWKADFLLSHGHAKQAKQILRTLSKKRGFYSMVASQKLNIHYHLHINKKIINHDKNLFKSIELSRINELMHWGEYKFANIEWIQYLLNKNHKQLRMLASYANEHNWWGFSVQATIKAKIWDNIKERFPIAWKNLYKKHTKNKNISQNYVMAVSRQESAWNPMANSPMGAKGLMQIIPKTAIYTAQTHGIHNYNNDTQLFNPNMNIKIGTYYLEYIYQYFKYNRILTLAAYNAGLKNVSNWIHNNVGKLDVIAFIESIPFLETREYIKNVLSYEVYYNYLIQGKVTNIITDSEWKHAY